MLASPAMGRGADISPVPAGLVAFRLLWIAMLISNLGTFVQDAGERWLMLELTHSALPSALLSTAFVLASMIALLPGGLIADRIDRRRIVISSQLAQAIVACAVGTASLCGWISPALLLAGAAAIGLSSALGYPAWNALVADLVGPEHVRDAVTFSAVAFNVARAAGPALGGAALAAFGAGATFFANAATFLFVIWAVATHPAPRRASSSSPPPRGLAEAVVHVVRDTGVRSVFTCMPLFALGASSLSVLAPAFAKLVLGAGPRAYGLVIGAIGLGAAAGAVCLKALRARWDTPRSLAALIALYGACSIALSRASGVALTVAVCVAAGVGWTANASLSALVQLGTASPLRGRVLALYTTIWMATWALGAAMSGAVADRLGVRAALGYGGVLCVAAAVVTARMPLPRSFAHPPEGDHVDVSREKPACTG
jgi:MFS family permease